MDSIDDDCATVCNEELVDAHLVNSPDKRVKVATLTDSNGSVYNLYCGVNYVGRNTKKALEVILLHPSVSRLHCIISAEAQRSLLPIVRIIDLLSGSFTSVF